MLNKFQLLQAGPKRETLKIAALNDTIGIRELTGSETVEYIQLQQKNPRKAIAFLITRGTYGEDGEPVFTDDDADAILRQGVAIPNLITTAVLKLSGLAEADEPSDPNAKKD